MRSQEERATVAGLIASGLNDCEISRATGIPRCTVRDWRHARPKAPVTPSYGTCERCGAPAHEFAQIDARAYAYLFGQYLGDGHIVEGRRGVYCLRIFMDLLHLNIAERCRWAILDVLPGSHVAFGVPPTSREIIVRSYSKQWPCLFPQHGAGKKHERKIELVSWQRTIVDQHPDQLVRGLIHSDGWRGTNKVTVKGKRYEYPRYSFTQVSDDIRLLFTDTLDRLDISWRQMKPFEISIARKADVAKLDAFVERKS